MELRLAPAILCLSFAFAQTPQKPEAWQTATTIPEVNLSGLTPVQKKAALEALRSQSCVCGCNMHVAECRIKDPSCADSRAISAAIVKAVKEGKNPQQAVAESDIVRRRSGTARLLEAPVKIPVQGAPFRGPADARITVVEFSDFECPFCSKAAAKIEAIRQAYPKDLRLVYKQYPLSSHPNARIAAEAALAAQAQDKFWPMHDKLFANSNQLSRETIDKIGKEVGLDMDKFQADLRSGKIAEIIKKDVADGDKADVDSTPTIFINGRRYNGPLEMDVLKPVLDAELKPKL
jgi:protein-disulfide isomerase